MTEATQQLLQDYYAAFNAADWSRFLGLLDDEVVHDINQGRRETGRPAFEAFMARMRRCYRERIVDFVIMSSPGGTRAAAEFTVLGEYLQTDGSLPPARGQPYRLAAGAFFEVRDGKIARVSNHDNLQDWLSQVGG